MKLTRLRLIGFKSFVEPTDFEIEPGLTGVVGPNGCGKSNLVEAVRWVMGEASYKAMRAAEMDDVIFSGNAGRPGRNHAEVTVSVDNSDRKAPASFNEDDTLEVSRRIMREQGSTFRVNGREVRARDVAMLFADASTGSRSPALVHQGRIGEIIQARPEARRRVLEEAAGISGLHARRHEAELRLKAAEQNLARVEDVIGQLAGQVAALKTQARQAVRYRNISGQVRRTEALLFHLRWIAAQSEVAETGRTKDEAVRVVAARTGEQAAASTRQAGVAATLPGLREAEAGAAAGLQRLIVARETLEREEARAKERIVELDRRIQQFAADLERERALAADAEAALQRLGAEEIALSAVAEETEQRLAGANERVLAADTTLSASEKSFTELTGALADLTARRNQLQTALREHEERAARLDAEFANIEAGLIATDSGAPDLVGLATAVTEAQSALTAAETAAHAAEAAHRQARENMDAARAPLAGAEKSMQRLETEAKTISKLLAVESKNLWPPVMDAITVTKGYEKALGSALGDDLDAPVGSSAPMHWAGATLDPSDPALPDGVTALSHYVAAPEELARRLAQVGVVERNDGPRLAAMLKPGQRLVSREGDFWRWDGFAVAAHAPTGAARRLAERGRLEEIESELASARSDVETKRLAAEAAEAALTAATAAETEARAHWREAQRLTDTAREHHAAAEREISRNAARVSALKEARQRTGAGRDEAKLARDEAEHGLAALPAAAEIESKLAEINAVIARQRGACAEQRGEAQAIAREAELADHRLRAIADERQGWDDRKANAAAQIATLEQRSHEAASERAELIDAPQKFELQRQSLIGEVETATAERRGAADRLATAETELAEADKAARLALELVGEARAEAARSEERSDAAKRRLADLEHEIREVLQVEPVSAAEVAELKPEAETPSIAEVEAKIERIKQERERLGSVNLLAEEELREVEGQHQKLIGERDDLVEAIRRLRQGIHSLNHEARDRLLTSFQTVNENFKKLFTELFGGGTAELQLIESEDPLEAGLEIMAKPPGKKPATLSLLSGGEQALTALALIFAVFLTNPAPICVLDEVDAPLDDYNVERFCNLLDEMTRSTETRFIIITHNPITMARMNRLYGVTMAERGVSQLVSVDLQGAVKLREAS
ncbi:MAG TPA: chromosome segregation protein SMC [Xanthobacteraceae bacterium]|jgi:chromosome segregation protein|nr:chromosome segregation protein SMC [Xanthobacteraceae bacterium]